MGGPHDDQFRAFVPQLKFAKILKSHYGVCVGVGGAVTTNFQLLFLSSDLLKSQSPLWWVGGLWWPISKVNFWNFIPNQIFYFWVGLVLTFSMHLGWTTKKWQEMFPTSLSECITDSFPSETKNISATLQQRPYQTSEAGLACWNGN